MSTTEHVKLPEIEHVKQRKDGLDVLADIYRYAELGFDAIEPDDLALFRWYGIYTQRAEQSAASGDPGPSEDTDGYFMLRIKFPNGVVTADQLRAVGRLSERYGRGMGDITTRQNIQLHWLRIEDMPVILDELNAVGLSFTQACGDVWRNVVGCPLAGVDGHELDDSRPLIEELERTFVGDRRFSNLPRKFKVSVSGCLHRCAQHEINDIGLVAVEKDGVVGYDVWVGGGLGASARMGRRLDVFVLPEEATEVCAAITEIYRDEGKRTKRTRARIKFLVDEWGVERLRAEVERKLGRTLPTSVAPADPVDPHRDHLGVHPQVEPGLYYLGATTLRGRFSGRSEEHTSELQSQSNIVCRLLLEKKKLHRRKATVRATARSLKIASPHFDPTELIVLVSEFSHGVRAEVFFCMITATTGIYTLSLHDALPI